MPEKLIPADIKLAAKRGFIRTSYQALAATLTGGVSASAIISLIQGEVDPVVAGVTFGVAVLSPFVAGAASYFDITSKGIPGDYKTKDTPSV